MDEVRATRRPRESGTGDYVWWVAMFGEIDYCSWVLPLEVYRHLPAGIWSFHSLEQAMNAMQQAWERAYG